MFFHVIVTSECNSQCRYCYGEALQDTDEDFEGLDVDYSLPKNISYNMSELSEFCARDPECVLTFYGGEPLLRLEEIGRIMDNVKVGHFLIQTNGLLLDRLDSAYVNRFHTILVSLDGDETLTDYYRGAGTFRKVVENLKLIKENGFNGELIARMTVMEQTDIYKQVEWLLDNSEFSFSSVHWQLNAGFWKNDFKRRTFSSWSRNNYNPGVRRLVKFWVDTMEQSKRVLRIYPFLGIAESLLFGDNESLLRCGGGWINYTIQTDGFIIPCPTMWGMKDYYLGHITKTDPASLKRVFVGNPCSKCDILNLCGGRCLYTNVTHRWSDKAYVHVCETVRTLIEAINDKAPIIKSLIEQEKIHRSDFEYMKYNGCEIIP